MSKASSILRRAIALWVVLLAACANEAAEIVLPRVATTLSESANGPSGGAAISADGRYVAFTSAADNLHPGAAGSAAVQVYVCDRQIETNIIVSINTNGVPGNGHSHSAAISSDGKLVVFQSEASDLVPGDTNGVSDIFLRNVATGEMKLISQPVVGTAASGHSRTPLFNSDATLVIFESFATNLVAVSDTNRASDIFIRDLAAGTNGLVTFRQGSANAANRGSLLGEVVAGAPRIFYKSEATNLAGATTSEQWFVHDWVMRTNFLVSRGSANATVYPVYAGALSRNGQVLAFVGDVRLTGGLQSSIRIFYRTVEDNVLRAVLVPNAADLAFANVAVSPSGSRIAVAARSGVYVLDAPSLALQKFDLTNFLAEATIPPIEFPAEDLLLIGGMGIHSVVETNAFGGPFKVQAIGGLFLARAEGSGEVAVSDPQAPGVDLNSEMDVFVAAEGELISRADPSLREPALEIEAHRQITAAPNGRTIIFTSSSSRLNASDTNGFADIYSWTPKNGEVKLLTLGTNGAATGPSGFPAISRDGRWMAFWSAASNLVADTYRFHDVLVQDLTTGSNELVTVPSVAAPALTDFPSELAISANGRYVAFASKRNDLTTPAGGASWTSVFVRDRELATNIWAFDATNTVATPVAIFEPLVWIWSRTNIFTYNLTNGIVTRIGAFSVPPVFSSDGSMAALRFFNRTSGGTNVISLHNTETGETRVLLATTNNFNNLDRMSLSDNGRVAFVSNLPLLPEDDDQTNDVYVVTSEETPRLFLVSAMTNEPGMTARASAPVITANGERVYFRSSTVGARFQRWNDLFVTTLADGKVERIALANGARAHAVSKPLLLQDGIGALVDYNDHGLENPSAFAELVMIENAPTVDSDLDGLPDDWELANFQSLAEGPSGDFDHDGMTNRAEFFAGTNATEAGSVLSLEISTSVEGRRINFPKLPEKTAVIQYRQSLSEGDWIDLPGGSTETGEGMTAVDTETVTTRFYRLRLNP